MGGTAPSILEANRRLRDALRAKGYDVEYHEVPNGVHSPESWRVRLPVGLVALAQSVMTRNPQRLGRPRPLDQRHDRAY
jgi:enterochelin esterase-like enzyme